MRWNLTWPIIALILLPIAVSLGYYQKLPTNFLVFPPLPPVVPPTPYLAWYFGLMLLVVLAVIAVFLFPKLIGIQGGTPNAPAQQKKLPIWGWIGAAFTLFFFYLMHWRPTSGPFASWVPFAFSPMWWGFIFFLDGLVYKRNDGVSLYSSKPKTLLASAIVSLFGWLTFEYFNYFVNSNWGYPPGTRDFLPYKLTVVLFLIAYTTVWPAIFVWYNLLNTFPKITARFQNGLKINFRGDWLLILGFVCMALMVISPQYLFFMMWIGPMAVFSGVLVWLKIPNPLTSIGNGNWAPIFMIFLACFCNGLFWEFWNYWSAHPNQLPYSNPNYWEYYLPFVDVPKIYSEMPLMGYFGYMPFGLLCWQVFIWAGNLFGFNTDFTVTTNGKL